MSVESPTPSMESTSHPSTPSGSLLDDDLRRSAEVSPQNSNPGSVSGNSGPVSTTCVGCNNTYNNPIVLPACLHTCCFGCAENSYQGTRQIKCPSCATLSKNVYPTELTTDFGMKRLLELGGEQPCCFVCKSRENAVQLYCTQCKGLICSTCMMSHSMEHSTGDVYGSSKTCLVAIADLATVSRNQCQQHGEELRHFCMTCDQQCCQICVDQLHFTHINSICPLQDFTQQLNEETLRLSATLNCRKTEYKSLLENLESYSGISCPVYQKIMASVNESYNQHLAILEDAKQTQINELKSWYHRKSQMHEVLARNLQEEKDQLNMTEEFLLRQKNYCNAVEMAVFKPLIETLIQKHNPQKYEEMVLYASSQDAEFVRNSSPINQVLKNSFGQVKVGEGRAYQKSVGPIARPSSSVSNVNNMNAINSGMSSLNFGSGIDINPPHMSNSVQQQQISMSQLGMSAPYSQSHHSPMSQHNISQLATTLAAAGFNDASRPNYTSMLGNKSSGFMNYDNSRLSNTEQHLPTSPITGTFDKWSPGTDSGNIYIPEKTIQSIGGVHQNNFPPRSSIRRQKMTYCCKFGEFGIVEGQFTEPSGVAVNAQNDIIVADTNNHRIQIFDKEGRFKFQFGECGKRDGQLLYPNRVAVVKNSGDIIVTERSPTHQIQIYNQYGAFVRKFGSNVLSYPRGVTVDKNGFIIVVECKVMKVIIFNQEGRVMMSFNCPNHLEFPNGVVVNDHNEIFISDNRAHCVKVFGYDGTYKRSIGGEGITNYPIGVGITSTGEVLIADNHNNFNLTVFKQNGEAISAYESKVKHAQCFDVALMDDGSVVLASKDYRLYVYRYMSQVHM